MTGQALPTLRITPRVADLNINGHIFGGWILSQMDIAGGITAGRLAKGAVATVAIEGMKFLQPVEIGDIVSVYTEVERIGTTSVTICVTVYAERRGRADAVKVTQGQFIFVALDDKGKPRPVAEA